MMLTRNFSLQELVKSQLATRHGIDNTPPEPAAENLRALAVHILQPVRDHYGVPITPSSGYRCLQLNRLLNSSDSSQHVKGQAVDFEVAGVSNHALARWIADKLVFDQLILEYHDPEDPHSGWIHCSYTLTTKHNRRQILTINTDGVTRGLA